MEELASHSQCATFLKSVEEWIRVAHKDKSDTLFVVVSFFFEKLLPEYYVAGRGGKLQTGRTDPFHSGHQDIRRAGPSRAAYVVASR